MTTLEPITVVATARTRRNFGYLHLLSAERFADELQQYEDEHAGEEFGPVWEPAWGLASASIMLSFAAIEAALNEATMDLGVPDVLASVIDKATFWDRCGALFAHLGKPPINRGRDPAQSVELLRALRNAIVHGKPEWSDELDSHAKLSARILAARLPLSPFVPPNPIDAFPLACMSAGAARWAVSTAAQFIIQFRTLAGVRPALAYREGRVALK